MTKPLTNRQITNGLIKKLKQYPGVTGVENDVKQLSDSLIILAPFIPAKDRHSIIINTTTRYVRYLLEQEDKLNAS